MRKAWKGEAALVGTWNGGPQQMSLEAVVFTALEEVKE